jgi:signal transduction histidine kinase
VLVVRFGGDHVDVEVTNDAAPVPASVRGEAGHGLVGMRERVGLLGGNLRASARAEGGFFVFASLPLGGPQP